MQEVEFVETAIIYETHRLGKMKMVGKLLLLERVHIYSGKTLLRYPFGIGWPA